MLVNTLQVHRPQYMCNVWGMQLFQSQLELRTLSLVVYRPHRAYTREKISSVSLHPRTQISLCTSWFTGRIVQLRPLPARLLHSAPALPLAPWAHAVGASSVTRSVCVSADSADDSPGDFHPHKAFTGNEVGDRNAAYRHIYQSASRSAAVKEGIVW